MKSQNRWTRFDLARLPEDLSRYELWDGELIMTPAPTMRHQELVRRLMKLFALLDPEDELGRLYSAAADVVFSDHWVYQPDLFFISKARLDIIKPRYVAGAPDLVIDILSPTTTAWAAARRRRVYEKFKVQEYWVINPFDKHLEIWALNNDIGRFEVVGDFVPGEMAHSVLLEGLTVGMSALFEDLPDEPPPFEEEEL